MEAQHGVALGRLLALLLCALALPQRAAVASDVLGDPAMNKEQAFMQASVLRRNQGVYNVLNVVLQSHLATTPPNLALNTHSLEHVLQVSLVERVLALAQQLDHTEIHIMEGGAHVQAMSNTNRGGEEVQRRVALVHQLNYAAGAGRAH